MPAMRRWGLVAAGAVAVVAIVAFGLRRPAGDAQRAALYAKTLEAVRTTCVPVTAATESYCRDQANLLLDFPECDAECVRLARQVRREPRR